MATLLPSVAKSSNPSQFNFFIKFYRNTRHERTPHYNGLFKLRREDGIGYPYLKAKLPPRSVLKWDFFDHPKLNQDQYNKDQFPVLLTKTVEGVGKAGDVVQVKRGFYRYFLLENNAAQPLTKYSRIPQHVLDRLAIRKPEIDNEQTKKDAYNKAISILTGGIHINFDPMAKWVITPFHLAQIVQYRTGFDVKPHHFRMETEEIRETGTHMVGFVHENGMNLTIPIIVNIWKRHQQ